MTALSAAPRNVAWLGYAGLVPFVAGAIGPWLPVWWAPAASLGFMGYSAAILAFLGGIQWGVALRAGADRLAERTVVGVLPALAGALAILLGARWGGGLLLAGFLLLLGWEAHRNRALLPGWYLPLRVRLTAGVAACHVAFLAQFLFA